MGILLATVLAATALATAPPAPPAPTNSPPPRIPDPSGFAVPSPLATEDPVERAYQNLLAMDDAAQAEMDAWIREADAQGEAADLAALQKRINDRIQGVSQAYEAFLTRHPDHVEGRIAFGSFLHDTGQEMAAREEWERALKLDPKRPSIYNNLAGIYGHRGPVTNAFAYYEKAIELDPTEAVYYQNFGTTVFLFRRDVMEYYGLKDEQQVFDKALALYRRSMELDPGNFILASDLAQTYYGIKPPRHDAALKAWNDAFKLAGDDLERQGVRVHLARVQGQAGLFEAARSNLNLITDPHYLPLKDRLARTLDRLEAESKTNRVARPAASP